jgi:hypothetical protein
VPRPSPFRSTDQQPRFTPGAAPVAKIGHLTFALAGIDRRVIARFLDGLILGLLAQFAGSGTVAAFIGLAASGAYEVVATKLFGQTLMKRAFRISVVSQIDAGRLTWTQSFLRWIVPASLLFLSGLSTTDSTASLIFALSFLPFLEAVISIVMMSRDPLRRSISDRIARSYVVQQAA